MPSYNSITVMGHLGRDPEIRFTGNGEAVASFSVATSEKWTKKNGEKQERTDWHRVEAWGKVVEIIRQYVHKGDLIFVEGKLRNEEWEKDGVKRTTAKIRLDRLVLMGKRSDGGGERPAAAPDRSGGAPDAAPVEGFVDDDDTPF